MKLNARMVREDTNHGERKIELPRFVSSRNEMRKSSSWVYIA